MKQDKSHYLKLIIPIVLVLILGVLIVINLNEPEIKTEEPTSIKPIKKNEYIEITGLEITKKNLEFIESMRKEDGSYYSYIDCLDENCEPFDYAEKVRRNKLSDLSLYNFVQYNIKKSSNYKVELKELLNELINTKDQEPELKQAHILLFIIDIIDSGIFKDDSFHEKLIEFSDEILKRHIQLFPDSYIEEKEIKYYFNEDVALPDEANNPKPSLLKSYLNSYGRLASTFAKSYKIKNNNLRINLAKNILSYANIFYSNLENEDLDKDELYKENSCYLVLAHINLYESTNDDKFLEFPLKYFNSIDFHSIYSRRMEDLPEWSTNIDSVLPCIASLQKLSSIKSDENYLETAKTISEFFLSNTFDYPQTRGFMMGDGSFEKTYYKDVEKRVSTNAYSSYLYSNQYFEDMKFKIKI